MFNFERGYVVLPNFFTVEEQEKAKACIEGKNVNYRKMQHFIDRIFMEKISNELNWYAKYTKYRVSNNNNASDASTFHRDIIKWSTNSDPEIESLNIYTCLMYLDDSDMELIPYSHIYTSSNAIESISKLSNKIRIHLKCGDALVFNAQLLHRGVFENIDINQDRRLIQVFDVHPTSAQAKLLSSRIFHIPAINRKSYSGIINWLSHNPISIKFMNLLGYLNADTGYGKDENTYHFLADNNMEKCLYLSSEGTRGRLDSDIENYKDKFEEGNLYVMCDNNHVNVPTDKIDVVLHRAYTTSYNYYVLIFILIIISIVASSINFYCCVKKYINKLNYSSVTSPS